VTEDSRIAEAIVAAKIRRALLSGPECVTKDARVVEMDAQGNMTTLRPGTNQWVCIPGNETLSEQQICVLIRWECGGCSI
jgi:hypothetical protein